MSANKIIIQTDRAPTPLGTYSQAVKVDKIVYNAGVIGIDPATGQLVEGGFEQQLHQVFKNLQQLCEAAGGSLDHIVQLTCYLVSMDDFPLVNKVMGQYIKDNYPARATLAVAGLPKNALVEIVSIMHLD